MNGIQDVTNEDIDENALKAVIVELKLQVNNRLFQKGVITEEMFSKAKELILKGE